MVSESLTRDRKNELKYAFRLYDKDGDGKLSFNTFKTLLKSIGIHLTKGELEFLKYGKIYIKMCK
eukprot:XP_764309.1 hypothetical protein [Theileria parva strain Muguga]